MYDHIGLRGGRGIGEWGISNQSHQQHPPAPKEVISGAHPIKTSKASKAGKARDNPGLAPGNRFQPVLPSTLGSCGFPREQTTLNPRALALAPDPPAGPPLLGAWQILPQEHLPLDWQPGNHGFPFLVPHKTSLFAIGRTARCCIMAQCWAWHPVRRGAIAVSWAERRYIDHQGKPWTLSLPFSRGGGAVAENVMRGH